MPRQLTSPIAVPLDAPAPCCAHFALFRPHFAPSSRFASPSPRFRRTENKTIEFNWSIKAAAFEAIDRLNGG